MLNRKMHQVEKVTSKCGRLIPNTIEMRFDFTHEFHQCVRDSPTSYNANSPIDSLSFLQKSLSFYLLSYSMYIVSAIEIGSSVFA